VIATYNVGIDPGKSGGVAVIAPNGAVTLHPMGSMASLHDLWKFFSNLSLEMKKHKNGELARADLELVTGYAPGTGNKVAPGSAMFNFGRSYGNVEMCLVAAGIPFGRVTPQGWMKRLSISPRRKEWTKTQWKNHLKGIAQEMFPRASVTHATADALLIAEALRRSRSGERSPRTSSG
jgi:hypothetical protein